LFGAFVAPAGGVDGPACAAPDGAAEVRGAALGAGVVCARAREANEKIPEQLAAMSVETTKRARMRVVLQ
jgi:hypothetical protein